MWLIIYEFVLKFCDSYLNFVIHPFYVLIMFKGLDFNTCLINSPVHVVLVSLLVDQLSSLFLPFFGRPKKYLFSLREFLVSLRFFWSTKCLFGVPKFLFSIPKNQSLTKKNSETDQNFFVGSLRLDNFFWSTKKNEK